MVVTNNSNITLSNSVAARLPYIGEMREEMRLDARAEENPVRTTLLLGGARSGKSRRALALAGAAGAAPLLIATAQPLDAEMAARIARHREERGAGWTVQEEPVALVQALASALETGRPVVVDCLTLWLANLFEAGADWRAQARALADMLTDHPEAPVVLVSNEIGLGLVPETPLGRDFRDAQGRLNQDVAAACAVVEFLAAGLPWRLKGPAG